MSSSPRRASFIVAFAVAAVVLELSGCVPPVPPAGPSQVGWLDAYYNGSCAQLDEWIGSGTHDLGQELDPEQRFVVSGILSRLFSARGMPDSARIYFRRAESSETPEVRAFTRSAAESFIVMGEAFHYAGNADSALVHYRRASALVPPDSTRLRALTDSGLGISHNRLGRPDSALVYLERSLVGWRALDQFGGTGTALNNVARVYQTLGQPQRAIDSLRVAVLLLRAAGRQATVAFALNNIGYSYDLLLRPDSALASYGRALGILEDVCRPTLRGNVLNNIGRSERLLARADPARRDSLLASAELHVKAGLELVIAVADSAGIAWAYAELGDLAYARGDREAAVAHLAREQALLAALGDPWRLSVSYAATARTYHRIEPPELDSAFRYYALADAAKRAVGARSGDDVNLVAFREQDLAVYEGWALAARALAESRPDEIHRKAGFTAADRGRTRGFLPAGDAPAREEPTPQALAREADLLLERLARTRSAALAYFVTADTLLGWLAHAGEIRPFRRPITRERLTELVMRFRDGYAADEAGGRRLAEQLLPPDLAARLDSLTELLIVPSGPLALVPFAALRLGDAGQPLVARHPVSYAPSVAFALRAPPTGEAGRAPLVLGQSERSVLFSELGWGIGLPALPGAVEEANAVGALLGLDSAEVLRDAQATEAAVRERVAGAPVLHFATHARAHDQDTLSRESYLALAEGDGHDGILTVREIMRPDFPAIQADLVVLSACETGFGDVQQIEGVVGLHRAFLARGARSVLASLWTVPDRSTATLMTEFYTVWLGGGVSLARALRRAMLTVREEHPGPRQWAAFQLFGAEIGGEIEAGIGGG